MNFRALAGNAAAAFAAQGVSFAASLVMSLLVPKVLGVEEFGYWQLFVFYASYSGFFQLGLNDGVYLTEGGRARDDVDKRSINSQFHMAAAMQAVTGAVVLLLALASSGQGERSFVLASFALYTVELNLSAYWGYLFQAVNETRRYSVMVIIERAVFLALMGALIAFGASRFEPFVISYLLARACASIYAFWKARDFFASGRLALGESVRAALANIRIGFRLMIANVASMLILGVPRALIDAIWGIEVFGRVSFALSAVSLFAAFVSQASMVLFPALRQGTGAERRAFYCSVRDAMGILSPLVYLLYFPMSWALSMWLPQYAESMRYLALLLPVCAFNAKMDICCTTFFKVLREERTLLRVNIVAVALSVVLAVFGVFAMGSVEAVLAGAVVAIAGRSVWSERWLDGRMGPGSPRILAGELLLAGGFVGLALLAPIRVAAPSYAVMYVVYLAVNRGTVRRLLQSTRRAFGK